MPRTRTRTTLGAAALLLVGLGSTSAGADPGAPQALDPCGDGGTTVTTGADRTQLEPAEPAHDLRSAAVRVVRPAGAPGVLLAELRTCGPADAAAAHSVAWQYADGCAVTLWRARTVQGEPSSRMDLRCAGDRPLVGDGPGTGLPADAVRVVGDTVRFEVPLSLVPAAVLPRLAPGTAWTTTRATVTAPSAAVSGYGVGLRVGSVDASTHASLRSDELAGGGGTVEQPEG